MAWLPTKGSIRRHMIRQVGGSQAASWHKTPRARCTLSFPAASGRVSVSAWQSHATINQICGRKRRKWCGLTAASQWRKPNYTARRSTPYPPPPHHHPALFLPLSCLNSLAATLNSFIPSVMGLFKAFPCHVILRVVTLTTLLVAKSHWLHLFRPTFSPAAAP